MTELKKKYNDYCNECFEIITDGGTFKIYCDYDFNLYWSPYIEDKDMYKNTFQYTVSNDDKFVYDLFNELYDSVMSKKPFKYSKYDADDTIYDDVEYDLIVDNGIEWHSDSFNYDAASVLRIDKDEKDNYIVTFKRSKVVSDEISAFTTCAVQFSRGISQYDPYNMTFIEMYNRLKDCDLLYNKVLYGTGILGKRKIKKR